jgi:hypothetical protein
MSGQIFISYRREESQWSARSLHDRLCRDFDANQIFMDLDAIDLGEDFVEAIETTVGRCDVLIAVIGNNWLNTKDERGSRRLDNPEDFVRMEIAAALKRKIRVIPVLVDGAVMPSSTDLPDDLKLIVRRNALRITGTSFDGDCQRLAATIRLVLQKAAVEGRQLLEAEQREKERLDAEQAEKERLEAGQREKQRLEVERRENERLQAQRLEKERLEAEQRDKERLEAQQRENERLEVERRLKEEDERQEVERKQPGRILTPEHPRLRLLERLPFVAFALVLVSWLLPFEYVNNRDWIGAEILCSDQVWSLYPLENFELLSAFLCALFLVISRFLAIYRWKAILELVVACVCSFSLTTWFFFPFQFTPYVRIGGYLACTFAAAGAVMKTFLFYYHRNCG